MATGYHFQSWELGLCRQGRGWNDWLDHPTKEQCIYDWAKSLSLTERSMAIGNAYILFPFGITLITNLLIVFMCAINCKSLCHVASVLQMWENMQYMVIIINMPRMWNKTEWQAITVLKLIGALCCIPYIWHISKDGTWHRMIYFYLSGLNTRNNWEIKLIYS